MNAQTMNTRPVTPAVFRSVMGSLPTGVTVITASDTDGVPLGLTVNAITSVSLDPPQLLICLAAERHTALTIRKTRKFAVNFLGAHQKDIATLFATSTESKFDSIMTHRGMLGLPLITGSLALAECEVSSIVESGDHLIIIGKVTAGTAGDGMPLLFFRRNFGAWNAT